MTFAYRFGGVLLTSDTALAGLRSVDPRTDDGLADRTGMTLTFDHDAPVPPDVIVYQWPGRYRTRLARIGDDWLIDSAIDGVFVVDRALSTIRVHSAMSPPHAALCDVLTRRILPRLITARGAVTIHAAAVATDGGAALLLGGSGAGKSTMTAALAATPGWSLLSDDLSMLWDGTPALVAPGATGVCLWPASRDGLGIDPAACVAMPGYDGKIRFDPPGAPATRPVPLRAMVFLARESSVEQPTLLPMSRAEALIAAARQLIQFNPAAPPTGERATLIARLNRIVRDVPMIRLVYPTRFSALPQVADMLGGVLAR